MKKKLEICDLCQLKNLTMLSEKKCFYCNYSICNDCSQSFGIKFEKGFGLFLSTRCTICSNCFLKLNLYNIPEEKRKSLFIKLFNLIFNLNEEGIRITEAAKAQIKKIGEQKSGN